MIKHASSHGLSVLFTTIIASFMVELMKELIPDLLDFINSFSNQLIALLGIPLKEDVLSIIIVASVLAIVWGIVFKLRFVK